MGAFKLIVVLVFLLVQVTHGLNLGLIAGDLRRHASPLVIKKISKHSPVFININSGLNPRTPLSLPKLPPKPPPLKLLESTKPSRKVPRSILSPLPKLPILPILTIFPPIMPPILPPLLPLFPKLPLLPILPHLPILPLPQKSKCSLKPLQIPIIKKSPLETLKSKLKIVKVPPLKIDKKDSIQKKLLDLRKNGSLTTAEYLKFKKLLLK